MGNNQSREQNIYKIGHKINYSALSPEKRLENKEYAMKNRKEYEPKWDEMAWVLFEEQMERKINFTVENKSRKIKIVSCPNTSPFTEYEVGDYVRLNDNSEKFALDIYDSNDMRLVGKVDSEGKVRDSEGNILKATNEYLGGVAEIRQQQLAAAEYSRWVTQTQSWTSWNM